MDENLKKVRWVECPSCSVEWTKLHPCAYIADDGKKVTSHLCVICAETLVAWDWLIFNHPMERAHTYTVWRKPRYLTVRVGKKMEQIDRPQNAHIVIELGDQQITAWSNGTGHPIRYKVRGSDEEHTAENIYALRSKILNTVPF